MTPRGRPDDGPSQGRAGQPPRAGGRTAGRLFNTVRRRLGVAVLAALLPTLAAAAGPDLQVMGLFRDRAVVQIGGKQRTLRPGETSPEGVKLISASAQEAVLEVAGRQAVYRLGSRISAEFSAPERPAAGARVWPAEDGTYSTRGTINGFPVRLLLDTGATKVAMNALEAKRLGIDYRVVGKPSLAATASGVVQSYDVVLDRVRVGDIELRDVQASVIDGAHPREVLLGMSFLSRVEMSRDGRVMELRHRF